MLHLKIEHDIFTGSRSTFYVIIFHSLAFDELKNVDK